MTANLLSLLTIPLCVGALAGQKPAKILGTPTKAHRGWVRAVQHAPAGDLALSASIDGQIKLWNTKSGAMVRAFGKEPLAWARFWDGGSKVASGHDDKKVRLWDAATGKELGQLAEVDAKVFPAIVLPDGKTLACALAKQEAITFFDLAANKRTASVPSPIALLTLLSCSSDGKLLAGSSTLGSQLWIWDLAGNKQVALVDMGREIGMPVSLAFAPDGKSLAVGTSKALALFKTDGTAEPTQVLQVPDACRSLCFAKDGKSIVIGSKSGRVTQIPLAGGKPLFDAGERDLGCLLYTSPSPRDS